MDDIGSSTPKIEECAMSQVDECVVNVREVDGRHRGFVVHTWCSSHNSGLATGSRALLRKALLRYLDQF